MLLKVYRRNSIITLILVKSIVVFIIPPLFSLWLQYYVSSLLSSTSTGRKENGFWFSQSSEYVV